MTRDPRRCVRLQTFKVSTGGLDTGAVPATLQSTALHYSSSKETLLGGVCKRLKTTHRSLKPSSLFASEILDPLPIVSCCDWHCTQDMKRCNSSLRR